MNPKISSKDKELNKRLELLELLISSSRLLNSTLNIDRLLRLIMKIVKKAINVEAISILFVDAGGKELIFELARGRRDEHVRRHRIPMGEGVAGWVAENRESLIVNDVREDRRFSLELEKKLGLKTNSIISIPLMRGNELIGVVEGVNKRNNEPFTNDDLAILLALGDHICTAIANARLYRQANRRRLANKLLNQVSISLGKSLSVDGVLQRIISNLKKLIHFNAFAIFVIDRDRGELVSVLHQGYSEKNQERIKLKHGEGLVGWVARHQTGIIVNNCREDKRYIEARAETHSEMVVPMLSRGTVIGIFNIESDRRNAYRRRDLRMLEAFAVQAAVSIERAELYEERRKKLEMQKELKVARTIQEFFTPRKSKRIGNFSIAGANFPSLTVSGDYYDFFPLKEPYFAFAIADVAGKGVPASLIMSSFRATLHTAAPYHISARQIATRANEILLETARPHDFVTAFIGVLNPQTGEVNYCNAGHNPPVLMDKKGNHRFLEVGGPVLGIFNNLRLEEGRLVLRDETLVCYTDGATDACNEADEEFGEARLIDSVCNYRMLTPREICRAVYTDLKTHVGGASSIDDVTLLVLKRR
jgi:sigma-B regulation protein RsbU (phosphoserine phosphatase)